MQCACPRELANGQKGYVELVARRGVHLADQTKAAAPTRLPLPTFRPHVLSLPLLLQGLPKESGHLKPSQL